MTDAERRLRELDRKHCWHPYTQHGIEAEALPVFAASGAELELAEGKRVIDGISSWWACLHGHAQPELLAAMRAQAERLDHVLFAGMTHEPAVELAAELSAVAPEGLSRVFFSDDGSTAVEVALKMIAQCWQHRGENQRRVFVAFEGAYHGDTFGAMALGDPEPFFLPFKDFLFRAERAPLDLDATDHVLTELDDQAAAVIIEPLVQGAAGMRMHTPEFLRGLRALCDRHGLPLIADEVMTGFGRTGSLFACDQAGIAPDVLCLAKGLTGGILPLAVTMCREEIYAAFLSDDRARAFFHGHTFTANPIASAVARASLELCRHDAVAERFTEIGTRIMAGIGDLADRPQVMEIRRCGGIVAIELRPASGEAAGYLARRSLDLRQAAIERGVLLRPLGNVLYAMPPACTSAVQADRIANVLNELVATWS